MDTYFHSFFKSLTSESMGCGHPDKVADAISDAILDVCLVQAPESWVGCETLVKGNQAVLAGGNTTKAELDYEQIVRDTVCRVMIDDTAFWMLSWWLEIRPGKSISIEVRALPAPTPMSHITPFK